MRFEWELELVTVSASVEDTPPFREMHVMPSTSGQADVASNSISPRTALADPHVHPSFSTTALIQYCIGTALDSWRFANILGRNFDNDDTGRSVADLNQRIFIPVGMDRSRG